MTYLIGFGGGGGEGLIVLLLGEGVKHKSYLDPCLKYVFAPLMTKSSRIFDPMAVLTPCTWGLTVFKESK